MHRFSDLTNGLLDGTGVKRHSSNAIDPQHDSLNLLVGSQSLSSGDASDYFLRVWTIVRAVGQIPHNGSTGTTANRLSPIGGPTSDLKLRLSEFPYSLCDVTCERPSAHLVQKEGSGPKRSLTATSSTFNHFCIRRASHTHTETDSEQTSPQTSAGTLETNCTRLECNPQTPLKASLNRAKNELTEPTFSRPAVDDCDAVRAETAEVVRLTLADYLNQLDGNTKKLNPVPKLATLHRLAGPPEFVQSTQKCVGLLNYSTTESRASEPQSGMDALSPQMNTSPEVYLLKRRAFLVTRLAERYTELLQLLQEELELTGHPPEGYNQYLHEYHSAREAAQRLKGNNDTSQQNVSINCLRTGLHSDHIPNATSGQEVTGEAVGRCSMSGPCLSTGLLGSRLQETRFPISPVTVRKAGLKLSPSAQCLLVTSRLSLHEDDRISMKNHNALFARPQTSLQTRSSRFRSLSMIKPGPSSWTAATTSGGVHRGSWAKRKEAASRTALFGRGSMARTDVVSLSLTDLRGSRSGSLSSDCEVNRMDDYIDSERGTSAGPSEVSAFSGISEPTSMDEKHQTQAIAWIDVEIAALRNIMEANLRCADEPSRRKESRKAYKQAAQMNERKIVRLERQREILKALRSNESEVISVDSFTISSGTDGASRCETILSELTPDNQGGDPLIEKGNLNASHKNPLSDSDFIRRKSDSFRVYHTEPRSRRSTPSLLGVFESVGCFSSTRTGAACTSSEETNNSTSASAANQMDLYRPNSSATTKKPWNSTVVTRYSPSSDVLTPLDRPLSSKPSTIITSKSRGSLSKRPQLLSRTPYEIPAGSVKRDKTRIGSNSMLNMTHLDSTSHTNLNGKLITTSEEVVDLEKPPPKRYTVKLRSYSPASFSTLAPPPSPAPLLRPAKTGLKSDQARGPFNPSDRESICFHLPAYRNDRSSERSTLKTPVTPAYAPSPSTPGRLERTRYPGGFPSPSSDLVRETHKQSTQTTREHWSQGNRDRCTISSSSPDRSRSNLDTPYLVKLTGRPEFRTSQITTAPVERPTLIHVVSPRAIRRLPIPDLPQSTFNVTHLPGSCVRGFSGSTVRITREVHSGTSPSPYCFVVPLLFVHR
ncbi:unnamed protein product [Dicrocoelium dendriticum]|nr:unnamed protein product [Dicrocoelium dendriticum]